MIVLSLFDGMSCGQIALYELGIIPAKYYASEIDKYAVEQTKINFPNTVQLGDVSNWKDWRIDWTTINLILAGSPCQGFSNAGKHLAFDDPRSALFFVFVDILNHVKKHNPEVNFLLENVNMRTEYLRIISEYVGVYPVNINSSLVSAQNRNRWYWTDIRLRKDGVSGKHYTDIPLPKERQIYIRDILENEIEERFYLKNPKLGFRGMDINGKARTLRTGGSMSQSDKHNCDLIAVPTKDTEQKRIRMFSPRERSRLQTVPDWYVWECSEAQQYKMLGNGWTVEVIKHILSFWDYPKKYKTLLTSDIMIMDRQKEIQSVSVSCTNYQKVKISAQATPQETQITYLNLLNVLMQREALVRTCPETPENVQLFETYNTQIKQLLGL